MQNVSLTNSTNSVPLSRMLNIVSMRRGGVSVPVKGNLIFKHINGLEDGRRSHISVSKALALNTMISRLALTKAQQGKISEMYKQFTMGNIKESEIVNAMRDMIHHNNKQPYTSSQSSVSGLLFNKQA